jgi:hypothetical protein
MNSHHQEPPAEPHDVPPEEEISNASAADDLAEESTEKANFTERHPEHFRNPPGSVRELREGDEREED